MCVYKTSVKGKTNRLGRYVVNGFFQKNKGSLARVPNFTYIDALLAKNVRYKDFCYFQGAMDVKLSIKAEYFSSHPCHRNKAQAKSEAISIKEELFHIA